MTQRRHLISLAETLAAHQGVTHYAISMRALGKGDFFKSMIDHGRDCRTQTDERLLQWFSDNWPGDLEGGVFLVIFWLGTLFILWGLP